MPALSDPLVPKWSTLPPTTAPTLTPSLRLGDRNALGVFGPLALSADGGTLAFTSGGMSVLTGHGWRAQSLVVWDVKRGQEPRHIESGHYSRGHVALMADGRTLSPGAPKITSAAEHVGSGM